MTVPLDFFFFLKKEKKSSQYMYYTDKRTYSAEAAKPADKR